MSTATHPLQTATSLAPTHNLPTYRWNPYQVNPSEVRVMCSPGGTPVARHPQEAFLERPRTNPITMPVKPRPQQPQRRSTPPREVDIAGVPLVTVPSRGDWDSVSSGGSAHTDEFPSLTGTPEEQSPSICPEPQQWVPMSMPMSVPVVRQRHSQQVSTLPHPQPTVVRQRPEHSDDKYDQQVRYGTSLVYHLRILASDNAICGAMHDTTAEQRDAMFVALLASNALVTELCCEYRGNVVSQLLSMTPAEDGRSERLLGNLLRSFPELCRHQHGTIALIRLYDNASAAFCEEVNRLVLANFNDLSVDPFGNFLVSRVIGYLLSAVAHATGQHVQRRPHRYDRRATKGTPEGQKDNNRAVCTPAQLTVAQKMEQQLLAMFCDSDVLYMLATNKFASHIIEAWVQNTTPTSFLATVGALVQNKDLVRALASHKVGNYPLQDILRRLGMEFSGSHPYTEDVAVLPEVVKDSPFAPNILKALQGRRKYAPNKGQQR